MMCECHVGSWIMRVAVVRYHVNVRFRVYGTGSFRGVEVTHDLSHCVGLVWKWSTSCTCHFQPNEFLSGKDMPILVWVLVGWNKRRLVGL